MTKGGIDMSLKEHHIKTSLDLDVDRIFINFQLKNGQEKEYKNLLNNFKNQLITRNAGEHQEYFVISSKNIILYNKRIYTIKHAKIANFLIESGIPIKTVSSVLNIPRAIIDDLLIFEKTK